MPWSNIEVPEMFSLDRDARERMAELEFKLGRKKQECEFLYKEIQNIFNALVEFKEIEISYGKEKIKAKLVE